MRTPLVSVVIVVRNVERYLGEAVDSILKQSFTDFELIVFDYGSTDKSKEIAATFAAADARVRLHGISANSLVDARNAGCALARGKYIAVMDADDVSLPNRLQLEVDFLEQHPEAGFAGGAAEWINPTGQKMWVLTFPTGDAELKDALLTHFPFCHSAILVRRELFQRIGGYRSSFVAGHDYDLCLRLAENAQAANVSEVVVKYRVHGSQVSLGKRQLQTLCKLAAQASASARKSGKPDPLDVAPEINPALLLRLGVTEPTQQAALFSDYQNWILCMFEAGEDAVALKASEEALNSNWKFVDRHQLGDLTYMAARLYWKQKRHLKSMFATLRAISLQPALAKRLTGPVRRRIPVF